MSSIYRISNNYLYVEIDTLGAEMKKIKNVKNNKEYLWNGDKRYWGRHSPILFPFIGRVYNGKYRINKKEFHMIPHGFARDMEFSLIEQKENEIWFELKSDEKTFSVYPYGFLLKAGYRLENNNLIVMWNIENLSDVEMQFSIGGHPAFYLPKVKEDEKKRYFIQFDTKDCIKSTQITTLGLASNRIIEYPLTEHKLKIDDRLFDQDALVLEDYQVSEVTIIDPDGNPYISVNVNCPVLGLWAPKGKNVPFVCIEPWYGRCDEEYYTGELKDRKWENTINSHEIWKDGYSVKFFI